MGMAGLAGQARLALSREQAVTRVSRMVRRQGWRQLEVLRLITLFCLQPEELLESGLNYETVRSMEPLCWPDLFHGSGLMA